MKEKIISTFNTCKQNFTYNFEFMDSDFEVSDLADLAAALYRVVCFGTLLAALPNFDSAV
jgi:hypothetical protein